MKKLVPKTSILRVTFLTCLLATGFLVASFAQKQPPANQPVAQADASTFNITVVPVGPTEAELQALKQMLPSLPAVASFLKGANFRHLYTESTGADQRGPHFRAIFYDYTKQRVITVEGAVSDPAASVARIVNGWQPPSSDEEFQDAVAVLRADPVLGAAVVSGAVTTYRPMPPVQDTHADGSAVRERVVNVGLLPASEKSSSRHQIVGVDIAGKRTLPYPTGAPQNASVAAAPPCGASNANQSTTSRGTAGQYQMTVTDGEGQTLWEMLITRPSASTGTMASAIDIQNVKYKGRLVMKRGHVPILNVQYVNGACGPYRDWQYQEGMFQANGTDVAGAPGFRDCGTNVATTEIDTGVDTGNFRGVAIYREGSEVVLLTEMEAGWYRYIDEWRFDANGTIRPRYGFGAVVNGCTCLTHDHHVYWRLDMDVDGPANSIYEIDIATVRPTINGGRPLPIATEKKALRAGAPPRYYAIRNLAAGRSYTLYPGSRDGAADTFGRGDMWFLRYKSGTTNLQNEFDDGHSSIGSNTEADLDQFVTNESLPDQDTVIWYHATVRHSPSGINSAMMCMPVGYEASGSAPLPADNMIGPDLVPAGF